MPTRQGNIDRVGEFATYAENWDGASVGGMLLIAMLAGAALAFFGWPSW